MDLIGGLLGAVGDLLQTLLGILFGGLPVPGLPVDPGLPIGPGLPGGGLPGVPPVVPPIVPPPM